MHRGYYCPSLTQDLWLGNTKRGRLCKKRPSEERLSHIYGFDAAERLIVVEHMHCSKEYILYDTGVTLGVEIDNANNASAVNICQYDKWKNSDIRMLFSHTEGRSGFLYDPRDVPLPAGSGYR